MEPAHQAKKVITICLDTLFVIQIGLNFYLLWHAIQDKFQAIESDHLYLKSNHLYLLLEICPGWHSIICSLSLQSNQIRLGQAQTNHAFHKLLSIDQAQIRTI